jgi:uncharacterized protein
MSVNRVPLRTGYFTEEGQILASKCKDCGQVFFPPRDRCMSCFSQNMESIKLSKTGKLYTYTVSRMPAAKYKPPFALAWVEFPEGVRVFSQLKDWEKVDLKIGMPVKVVIDTLWTEETKEVYGYKFAPVT